MGDRRLILNLDFDGVLHSYASGWKGADVIPDPPVPGAIEFVREALKHFRVCICSSRCVEDNHDVRMVDGEGSARVVAPAANWEGIEAMHAWLQANGLTQAEVDQIEFWVAKPPAHVMIDDRAVCFEGPNWHGPLDELMQRIKDFRPWNKQQR